VAVLCGFVFTQKASAIAPTSGLVHRLGLVESEVIDSYMGSSSTAPRRYSDGTWVADGGVECWECYDAAGTAAGVLSEQGFGGPEFEHVAVETTNHAISEHQRADGAFEGSKTQSEGVATAFYAVQLGLSYVELHNELDPETAARWASALTAAARFLVNSGQTTWYVNGNINLRQVEVLWLAWQVSNEPYFEKMYEAAWTFTMAPPTPRWAGFGLHLAVPPTRPDWSDGAGYLSESGGGEPGFDPEYTMLQLDTAAQMYVLSREMRWLRLENVLYNQLAPHVEVTAPPRSAWDLNGLGGSRRSEVVPFTTPAPYVLATAGGRPELVGDLAPQFASIENEFRGAMAFTNAVLYRDLAEELTTPMLEEQWPSGITGAFVHSRGRGAQRRSRRRARRSS
jgi:hypothetical protein